MKIVKKVQISAPAEKVWEAVGNNYEAAGVWSSAIYASAATAGEIVDGAPVSGRVCETTLGPFTESIVAYNEERMTLAYVASGDKMPGFVKQLKGTWHLTPRGKKATEVSMEFNADIKAPFDVLMGWMMKLQFGKAIGTTLEDLKYYVEHNSKKHPRKLKFDSTKKAAEARKTFTAYSPEDLGSV